MHPCSLFLLGIRNKLFCANHGFSQCSCIYTDSWPPAKFRQRVEVGGHSTRRGQGNEDSCRLYCNRKVCCNGVPVFVYLRHHCIFPVKYFNINKITFLCSSHLRTEHLLLLIESLGAEKIKKRILLPEFWLHNVLKQIRQIVLFLAMKFVPVNNID